MGTDSRKQNKPQPESSRLSKPLPKRPAQILEFIRETITEHQYSPSIREICDAIGLSAPANVHRHLNTLEQRGYITRAANPGRTIRITNRTNRSRETGAEETGSFETPTQGLLLAGVITAGQPLETFQQEERLDLGSLYDSEDYFGLKVTGDSMIEACIQSGDIVVIKKQNTCRNGQIVAALIDGDETTLKQFFREKKRIRLQPANKSMKPIYPRQCEIQGVAVGVLRTQL